MRRCGVEYNSPTRDAPVTLDFADAWGKDFPHAFAALGVRPHPRPQRGAQRPVWHRAHADGKVSGYPCWLPFPST